MAQLVLITSARRNMGKTQLGTMIVRFLRSQGLHVAAVKHVHHGVDYRVKDTGRYLEAGAEVVYALGPSETMIVYSRPATLTDTLENLLKANIDAIIVEGFKEHATELKTLGACWAHISEKEVVIETSQATLKVRDVGEAYSVLTRLLRENQCSITTGAGQPSTPQKNG